jgi:hypothetical protein
VLWGERITRRRVLVGLVVAVASLDVALALVVTSGSRAAAPAASPLHPVVQDFRPDSTRLLECSDEGCFQQAFGNIAFREGPAAALRLVGEIYDGGDPACHRVMHIIGAASLVRLGGNVTKTLAEGDPACWSGYYHGVVERSLVKARSRDPEVLASVARAACADRTLEPWVLYGCFHGLGHGLMISTGLNLPRSLEACARLVHWWDRDACRGGVFMENLSGSYGFQSTFLKDDDPVYPCNWVAREAKRRCYGLVTSRVLGFVGDDFARAAEVCARVEPAFVGWCFRSLGRDASSRSGRDAPTILERCEAARPYAHEAECIEAAAYDITANFTSGMRGADFCERVDADLREACFYGVGSVMGRFTKTPRERMADCEEIALSPAHVAACIRGGRANLPRA